MKCSDSKLGRDIFEADLIDDAGRRQEVLHHRGTCEFCRTKWDEYLSLVKGVQHEFHPTADDLYEFAKADGEALENLQHQRVKAHLTGCDQCREVYEITHDLLRGDQLEQGIEWSRGEAEAPMPLGFRARYALLRPAIAVGAIGIGILAVTGIWIGRSLLRSEPPAFRGSTSINLIDPPDGADVRIYQDFKWQADPSFINKFVFIIREPGGGPVVTQAINGSSYILDASAAAVLKSGTVYEWSVTLTSRSGTATPDDSPVRRFTYLGPHTSRVYHDYDQKKRETMLDTARNGTPDQVERLIRETTAYLKRVASAAAADRAWASYVTGVALYNSNQAAEAAENFRNAIAIWDQNGHPDASIFPVNLYPRALINYALASEDSGDPSTAVKNYKNALLTLGDVNDPEGLATKSTCFLDLGTLYRNVGLPEQAKDAYDRAFKIDQQLANKESMADELTNIGNILVGELDDPEQGLHILEEARDIRLAQSRESSGRFARNAADTFDGLGTAYEEVGRFDDALVAYGATAEIDSQYGSRGGKAATIINRGELFLMGLNNVDLASVEFKHAVKELEGQKDADPEDVWRAYDGLGRTELRSGDVASAERHFLKALDVTSRIKTNFGDKQIGRTFNASHSLPAYSLALLYRTTGDARRFIDIVEQTKASALRKDDTAGATHENLDIDGLRSQLPDASAALIYLTGSPKDPTLLLALTKDSTAWYDLPPPKQINPAIRDFVAGLRSGDLDRGTDATANLSNTLIPDPLIKSFSEAKITRLLINPDGELFNAPFDALPIASDGPSDFLIRHFEVSIVPSFSWMRRLRGEIGSRNQLVSAALIIANPSIDEQNCRPSGLQADTLPQMGEWRDLSGTVDEAQSVLRYASPGSLLLSGGSATSSNFRNEDLQQFQIIHFATHAFLGRTLQTSSLLFGCRSDPDVITGDEVTKLHLSDQLVILSACDTAVGKALATEGNDSLAWSFLSAGAGDSVASRWNIEDRAAAEFVDLFYENLSKGMTVDTALRNAKLTEIDDLHRPAQDWASFTSIGYGDLTIGLRDSGTIARLWPAAVLILVVAGSLALQFLQRRT